jgi:hypothetical protein
VRSPARRTVGSTTRRCSCGAVTSRRCAATIALNLAEAGVTSVRSQPELAAADELPRWLGDPAFHRSHQAALVRKDPEHYGPLFPGVPADLEYVWPTRREQPDPTPQRAGHARAERAQTTE